METYPGALDLPYKTTTAVNLAASIGAMGESVLLVDSDPQGNTTSGLGINKAKIEQCIYDVLLEDASVEKVMLETEVPNVFLLPATIELAASEIQLSQSISRELRLKHALKTVVDRFSYILIDCPPSLGLITLNALSAADSVLIPIQCEFYALEGLGQLMNTIQLVQKHLNKQLDIEGIVLTMFDRRTNLSLQVMDEVKKYFRKQVYRTVIPRNIRLGEAPSFGKPILMYDGRSKGALCYMELAKEVVQDGA